MGHGKLRGLGFSIHYSGALCQVLCPFFSPLPPLVGGASAQSFVGLRSACSTKHSLPCPSRSAWRAPARHLLFDLRKCTLCSPFFVFGSSRA